MHTCCGVERGWGDGADTWRMVGQRRVNKCARVSENSCDLSSSTFIITKPKLFNCIKFHLQKEYLENKEEVRQKEMEVFSIQI